MLILMPYQFFLTKITANLLKLKCGFVYKNNFKKGDCMFSINKTWVIQDHRNHQLSNKGFNTTSSNNNFCKLQNTNTNIFPTSRYKVSPVDPS